MLIRNIKLAWRNFRKEKLISTISLGGLILGIAFCLLILLWLKDERSVDAFHDNSDRIFNIYEREFADGKVNHDYSTPGLLADELKKKIPEIEYAAVFDRNNLTALQAGDKSVKFEGLYANEDFLHVLSFPLILGNKDNVLKHPTSIIISQRMAQALFGSSNNAMGQIVRYADRDEFKVTGVFANVPEQSSMKFEYVINWHSFMEQNPWFTNFGNTAPFTTVLLRDNADPEKVRAKVKGFLHDYDYGEGPGYRIELDMQRYDEQYLYSNFKEGYITGGRIDYVNLFSIVAIFVLSIACINFMNMSTARSLKRAREIGVRKIVGAARRTLIAQFITEAMFSAVIAVIASLILVQLLLPAFNSLTEKNIAVQWMDYKFWLEVCTITIGAGLLAGTYPAFYISSFEPVKALKGNLKFRWNAVLFRKGLIVFQFTLSILLIVVTLVVGRQVKYIQSKNLGFQRDNLLYIPIEGKLESEFAVFRKAAIQVNGVQSVSAMTSAPTSIDSWTNSAYWKGKNENDRPSFAQITVAPDFVKTIKGEMIAGSDFSGNYQSDSAKFIINESAAKRMGFDHPVNQNLIFASVSGTIIGVVKDFHFRSLHEPMRPLVIRASTQPGYGNILVRIAAGKTSEVLSSMEKICKELNPNFPFTYRFADEEYGKLYSSEKLAGELSKYFSMLAIVISCMGLLGLIVFSAEQRTKEIGIRKTLGAGVRSITTLLSKDIVMLVLIAFAIATPLSWFAADNWLQSFEYRIKLDGWVFVEAGIATLVIALGTISFQVIKSALANPVKCLRSE